MTQKPILYVLKEMGLTDLQICQNLQNSEFFYFNKPILTNSIFNPNKLLRFNLNRKYYKNLSEFSRIFDSSYYYLGKIGRSKVNSSLDIKISQRIIRITYADIFAIIDKLIMLSIYYCHILLFHVITISFCRLRFVSANLHSV